MRRALPHFQLINASQYRGAARALAKGQDHPSAECEGFASDACKANRLLSVECTRGACDNRTAQRKAFARMIVRPLKGDGDQWAGVMVEDGKKGDVVEEYLGEVLTLEDFMLRVPAMRQMDKWYFCALSKDLVIDATRMGSYARFINHSCSPNAALKPWSVATYRRVLVTLTEDVGAGREVTLSYDYESGEMTQPCWCGAPTCQGFIRRLPAPPKQKGDSAATSGSSVLEQCLREAEGNTASPEPVDHSPPTSSDSELGEEDVAVGSEPDHVMKEEEEEVMPRRPPPAGVGTVGPPAPVTPPEESSPTDDEVLAAVGALAPQVQKSAVGPVAQEAWATLGVLFRLLPEEGARRSLLASSHADNVRAVLTQQGPPYILRRVVEFPPGGAGTEFRLAVSSSDVIDLTDSLPASPRLDEGNDGGRLSSTGDQSRPHASPSAGGKGVGCE
mmetsp:Transcript_30389/g.62613  ORF Transcript_30389/g.62613 Transcript_30389/m.62613 type:complete len:446 (-) Transcript_30389:2352-3689(-)